LNAVEIEQAITDLAEQPFDTTEFPFAFLEAFGNKGSAIKKLRDGASNKSDIEGVLQANHIHLKTCEAALKCVFRGDPATCTDSIRAPIPI
jgi:RNase P/RNase MRP subunit POP5